jgi:hypothetical protein
MRAPLRRLVPVPPGFPPGADSAFLDRDWRLLSLIRNQITYRLSG